MRIASLNIWNIRNPRSRWAVDLPNELRRIAPDVLLLQEISLEGVGQPQSRSIARQLGHKYERFFLAGSWQGRAEGLSIVSRYPIVRTFCAALPTGSDQMGRIVCGARLKFQDKELDVYTTHLAFPIESTSDRQRQALAAKEFILSINNSFSERPLIFTGDFNDQPCSPAVHEIVETMPTLLDVMGAAAGSQRVTFAAANPYVDSSLGADRCIDYMFVSSHWTVTKAELFGIGRGESTIISDHYGISAEMSAP